MKQYSLTKTIKSVSTKTFEISLRERPNGRYYISKAFPFTNLTQDTSDMIDYNLATQTFEHVLEKSQGN